jgi:hypothetical protein
MLLAMSGALTVALVASVAALVSAILAPVTNWVVATAAHRHEREMRVREDKLRAYTSLLRECRRRQVVAQQLIGILRQVPAPANVELAEGLEYDMTRWLDESALTYAVASDAVGAQLDRFEEFVAAFLELDFAGADDPATRPGIIAAATAVDMGMTQHYHLLTKTIRDEVAR